MKNYQSYNDEDIIKFVSEIILPEINKMNKYLSLNQKNKKYNDKIQESMAKIMYEVSPLTINYTKIVLYYILFLSKDIEKTVSEIIRIFNDLNNLLISTFNNK